MEKTLHVRTLEKQIERIVQFIQPYSAFANCHMVEFITQDLWEKFIPVQIRKEIAGNHDLAYQMLCKNSPSDSHLDLPALPLFIRETYNVTLNGLGISNQISDLSGKFIDCGYAKQTKLKVNSFMSEKKRHEVNKMAAMIATMVSAESLSHILDLGDGKGYLSSLLALHYNIPVLGVDCSPVNTRGSSKRLQKMKRNWNPPKDITLGLTYCPYQQTTMFVTENTPLTELLQTHFPSDQCQRIGLVGLHTCGNLAATSIRIFTTTPAVKMLCNVGCCYHFLEEEYAPLCEEQFQTGNGVRSGEMCGFPLSKYLRARRFRLGRNARMLAAQSLDRVAGNAQTPSRSLFFRALLQVFLLEKCGGNMPTGQVGRKGAKCATFYEYVQTALKNFDADVDICEKDLIAYETKYAAYEEKIFLFYLIRMRLAAVIESLILADRLLYLKEIGYEHSHIIQLFEPVISPRCYAIVSVKD